jgi:hypothetical protein
MTLKILNLNFKAVVRMKNEGGKSSKQSGKDSEMTMADLHKVEELEKKVTTELDKLKEKKRVMDDELIMFTDLEGLKRKSEARKQQLVVEKQNLGRYRENIKYELHSLQSQFEAIQAQLYDNDTHNQVCI